MAGEPAVGALPNITNALSGHLRPPPLPHDNHCHLDLSSAQDHSLAHSKLSSLSHKIIAALTALLASKTAQALRTLNDILPPSGPSKIPSSSSSTTAAGWISRSLKDELACSDHSSDSTRSLLGPLIKTQYPQASLNIKTQDLILPLISDLTPSLVSGFGSYAIYHKFFTTTTTTTTNDDD
ncbi:hypothetical protein PGTUg99_035254 [Puccinia graminis f. sp. tritici]|uniref:Uncharacterized protein n=1 Tax=Puccinia graminis f. sp. tritici TaxID=56615 RepID=A0A5B0RBV2_PUCGR|nr:hypothetical protein PGTUg99_035254 [Puccinia graminis f. sp. tritici]